MGDLAVRGRSGNLGYSKFLRIMSTYTSKRYFSFLLITGILFGEVRIKDLVTVENAAQEPLVGYGLVVGLNNTGDRSNGNRGAVFTVQTISNMLERFGITVSKDQLRTRNVAAVMVTSSTPPFGRVGSQFDVVVSSIGDATSLEGGTLLLTPLLNGKGEYYAQCQGPVSIGGYNIVTEAGERVRKNHALVGRVPNGGILIRSMPNQAFDLTQPLRLVLRDPDFSTSQRIADEINTVYSGYTVDENGLMVTTHLARAVSAGVVEFTFPDTITTQEEAVFIIAAVETLRVSPDIEARVVLNERTGTIVAGGNVVIQEVMISHGSLTIHTNQKPIISQPLAPFSNAGKTVVVPVTRTQVNEAESTSAVIPTVSTVSDLAQALNELGLKPRDIIAIFQAIKQAGALNAKLIIM